MKNIKKFFVLLLLTSSIVSQGQTNTGDTIKIRAHNATNMTWYGNYDSWAQFPDTSLSFRKIIMKYTMGCATGGCSDWDYTSKIELRQHTGLTDSTLNYKWWFSVNNNSIDSFAYSNYPTFKTIWNENLSKTDTIWNNLSIVIYLDSNSNPPMPIDTLNCFEASYWNSVYDENGNKIDSNFVTPEQTIINRKLFYFSLFEVINSFELARVITPYGGYMRQGQQGFTNAWTFTHEFDVTDFSNLLRDSVEIRAFYDGWSSGFSVTLDFEFIVGIPPRNVKRIENLWNGGFSYPNSTSFETNALFPKKIKYNFSEKGSMIRIIPTGHGFDNDVYCAEFCPRSYFLKINEIQQFTSLIWNDQCGFNPIYPQAGTWVYDRANWCPGLAAKIFTHELTPLISYQDSTTIDLDLENYSWNGNQTPSYYISSQLLTYSDPNFLLDAELYDIISPSNKDEFQRLNPICNNPQIIIRNSGSNTLNTLTIHYGLINGNLQTYQWHGNLKFMEKETISLTGFDWNNSLNNKFIVFINQPNEQEDMNKVNDTLVSEVNFPEIINQKDIVVEIKTNNAGSQNSWKILDYSGNIIAERNNLSNNLNYRDTIHLNNNECYVFELIDTGGDGLSFFANDDGNGYVRFRKANALGFIKTFNPNFGNKIIYPFSVNTELQINEIADFKNFNMYPNPANNEFFVDFFDNKPIKITLFDITGRIIELNAINIDENLIKFDVSNLINGVYLVNIFDGYITTSKKLIIQK